MAKGKRAGVTGPLLRFEAEELVNEMSKNDFVHVHISVYPQQKSKTDSNARVPK